MQNRTRNSNRSSLSPGGFHPASNILELTRGLGQRPKAARRGQRRFWKLSLQFSRTKNNPPGLEQQNRTRRRALPSRAAGAGVPNNREPVEQSRWKQLEMALE